MKRAPRQETIANMKTFLLLSAVLSTQLFAPREAGVLASSNAAESARPAEYEYDAPVPGTYTLPVIKPAADGKLLNADGKPTRLRDVTRGRVTVLSSSTRAAASRVHAPMRPEFYVNCTTRALMTPDSPKRCAW